MPTDPFGLVCLSPLDTHKHTTIFAKVLRPLLPAAAECGVRIVRNPFGPTPSFAIE
jgi:hypothetical protein